MTPLPAWISLTALAAVAVAAGPPVAMDSEDTPITIYTHFEQPYSKTSVGQMEREIGEILRPAGLSVEWRSLDGARGEESAVQLVVVTFKGKCGMNELGPAATAPGALGSTHVSDGVVLPFTDVYCDRIRGMIESRVRAEDAETRERSLGRAMGRVLAHELYHVITRTTSHASGGLAKPYYDAGDLLARKFGFRQKEAGELRALSLGALARSAGEGLPGGGR